VEGFREYAIVGIGWRLTILTRRIGRILRKLEKFPGDRSEARHMSPWSANATPPQARVIAGSGRSGTTWLLDQLATANGLRPIFEPLHPAGPADIQDLAGRYLRPDHEAPHLEQAMRRVLVGEHVGLWANARVVPRSLGRFDSPKLMAGRLIQLGRGYREYLRTRHGPPLVKFIRANLLSGWLAKRCSARVLLLVRHPGGVVASRLKLGSKVWAEPKQVLRAYLQQDALVRDYLSGVRGLLEGPLGPVALYTAIWCVENTVPLRLAEANGVAVAFYEKLVYSDEDEWQRLLRHLDLQARPDAGGLQHPSQQVSEELKRKRFKPEHTARWMDRLGPTGCEELQRVLSAFGVEVYDAAHPMPRI